MKRYVIHHNDADGFGGALAAWLKFGSHKTEYIAVDHDGNGPPSMEAGSEICDYSCIKTLMNITGARSARLTLQVQNEEAI